MFAALDIQHAMRMRHIFICGQSASTIFFLRYLINVVMEVQWENQEQDGMTSADARNTRIEETNRRQGRMEVSSEGDQGRMGLGAP